MLLPPVRAELGRRKWEAGQYDFDDMLSLVDEALRGPRGPELARGMRERWRHVLIDEFQDTDETQWSIFRRGFFDRSEEAPSVLCLVGDPKQSIYRFRGADVDTYLRARAEVTGQGGGLTLLDHNYRATPDLVRATNAIFDQGAPNPFFTGSLRYAPIACGRPERTLVDGARRPVSPVHAMCLRASMPAPLSALGAWIASEVTAIVDASHPWQLDGRPLDHGDVFVLTRTSREGRIIGGALRTAGVPHTFYKQDGLFQTDEAKDIRALLGAVDEPGDRARRLAAWLTPFFGLSLPAIDRARDLPSDHPLVSRLLAWKSIADTRDFDRLFEAITLESGFVRREIFFGDGERELTNFLHLFELLLEYAHGTQSTLSDLVRTLSGLIEGTRLPLDLEGSVQRIESERDAVQIMTIHKSKGLEAPIVFVAGGSGQVRSDDVRVYHAEGHRLAWVGAISDPEVDARAKAEEHEEDQRLMYVALTRAKGRLYLPCMTADRQSGGDDGSQRESKATRGPYGVVQRRLVDLIEAGASFVTTVDVPAAPPRNPAPAGPGGWTPPATLLRPADERAMGDLRRGRLGPFVTSYTRMRGEQHAARTAPVRRPVVEPQDDAAGSELRGARTSGVFLHELLERLPLESFVDRDVDAWRSRPDVSSLFDEAMAAHRIDRAQRAHAEQLVWAAYTTPLELPGGARIDGIAATRGVVREMDFVFPVPDDGEPSRAPSARGLRARLDRSRVREPRGDLLRRLEERLALILCPRRLARARPRPLRNAGAALRSGHREAPRPGDARAIRRALRRNALLLSSRHGRERTRHLVGSAFLGRGEGVGGRALLDARTPWSDVAVSQLTPNGTAKARFLAERAREESTITKELAGDPDDVEPAYLGWELARCAPDLTAEEARAAAALGAACILAVRAGSTRLAVDERGLTDALAPLGAADCVPVARAMLARARRGDAKDPVSAIVGRGTDRKPLIIDGDWLYPERMRVLEDRFCQRVRDRVVRPRPESDARAIGRALAAVAGGPAPLTDEQKRAVREGLTAPLALVTGGPGTGKTTIVVALLRAAAWMGMPIEAIAIAAPTGKAARRLHEAIATGLASTSSDIGEAALRLGPPAPQTLHRLLAWSPASGRFGRHENDPLPHKLVVVDEASMVDLAMMDRLVRALPEDARLVLLGDADQLPSVEAGAVFRDLCSSLPTVRLSKNLRVGRDESARRIVTAAAAINAGVIDARFTESVETRRSVKDVAFRGVEHLAAPWPDVGDALLERYWRERAAASDEFTRRALRLYRTRSGVFDEADRADLDALFAHHARTRVLCATRAAGAETGADAINERLLAKLRRSARISARPWRQRPPQWAPGAPVMVERNDYERQLFNGDPGIVVRVDGGNAERSELMAVFRQGDGFRALPPDGPTQIAPTFAMTVHKAQGSEFDDVVLVLPDADLPLLTRELLYTAMTRARRSVLFVGPMDLLARAISRTVERHTGLADKLVTSRG